MPRARAIGSDAAVPRASRFSPGGSLTTTLIYAVLILHLLMTVFPLLWVLVNSFRTSDDIVTSIRLIPESFDPSNYLRLMQATSIPRAFFNSVTITAISIVLLLATATPLAFALARFRFRAAPVLYMFFSLAILVPTVSLLPMTFKLFNDLGLLGTRYGISLIYATEQLPISVFLLVTFMRAIPPELDEAAIMDGATSWQLFWRVTLPLSRNGIVTITILAFVSIWNDYLTALILLPDQANRTLSVVLAYAKDEYRIDYGLMSAAIVFAVVPMLVAYFFLRRQLMAGVAAGAVKG